MKYKLEETDKLESSCTQNIRYAKAIYSLAMNWLIMYHQVNLDFIYKLVKPHLPGLGLKLLAYST